MMPIALDRARGLGALEPTITPNQRTITNSKMHIGTQPRIEGDPLAIGLGGWGRSGTIFSGLSGRPSAARRPATPPKPSGAQKPPKTHVHETGAPCTCVCQKNVHGAPLNTQVHGAPVFFLHVHHATYIYIYIHIYIYIEINMCTVHLFIL